MKIRTGFVSNSSSSSFTINRYCLSQRQIDQIKDHIEVSKTLTCASQFGWCNRKHDAWSIYVDDDSVSGYTTMDNFDMYHFLRQIGVDDVDVVWE
jgi:hypothetical protein